MKKLGVVVSLVFVLSILAIGFVSAQTIFEQIVTTAEQFYDSVLKPFGIFLLGKDSSTGELFFAKLLLFILIASLVWYAADKFPPTHGKRAVLVSAIVSILAVRFITETWVNTIVLPYTAFGIAVTALIPLILFFFFVETGLVGQPSLRKICWIFAAVVFVGLFLYRYDVPYVGANDKGLEPGHLYLFSSLACLIVLFLDKTIQRAFNKAKYSNISELRNIRIQADLLEEYEKIRDRMAKGTLTKDHATTLIKAIRAKAKVNGLDENIFKLS